MMQPLFDGPKSAQHPIKKNLKRFKNRQTIQNKMNADSVNLETLFGFLSFPSLLCFVKINTDSVNLYPMVWSRALNTNSSHEYIMNYCHILNPPPFKM